MSIGTGVTLLWSFNRHFQLFGPALPNVALSGARHFLYLEIPLKYLRLLSARSMLSQAAFLFPLVVLGCIVTPKYHVNSCFWT